MKDENSQKSIRLEITGTNCKMVNFTELFDILKDLKRSNNHFHYDQHILIQNLHKHELMDTCMVARLRELYRLRKLPVQHPIIFTNSILEVKKLRLENKHDRKNIIMAIMNVKELIKHTEYLIRDLYIILRELRDKYSEEQLNTYRYKLYRTAYTHGVSHYEVSVCKPIQMVSIPS
jgi:hypothetical protein